MIGVRQDTRFKHTESQAYRLVAFISALVAQRLFVGIREPPAKQKLQVSSMSQSSSLMASRSHIPVPWQEIASIVNLQRLLNMSNNEIVVLSRTC